MPYRRIFQQLAAEAASSAMAVASAAPTADGLSDALTHTCQKHRVQHLIRQEETQRENVETDLKGNSTRCPPDWLGP